MSRSARRTTLIRGSALLLVVGLAGGLYIGLRGDRTPTSVEVAPGSIPSAVTRTQFSFHLGAIRPIPTGRKKNAEPAARGAAQLVSATLDRLYDTGFLDPASWQHGTYGDAWRLFTSDALPTARADESTLTLGAHAGGRYQVVYPHAGHLAVRVLMDRYGHPSTAVAIVSFAARAMELNGQKAVIRSGGQYFLRPGPRGWAIYGYQVKRDDAGLSRMAAIQP
jgi:hypothetical protein